MLSATSPKTSSSTATERTRARPATRAAKSDATADELAAKSDDDDDDLVGPPRPVACPRTPEGKPTDKAQRNFTDPDSRIMVQSGAFVQAYNAQAAVSSDPTSSSRPPSPTSPRTASISSPCSNACERTAARSPRRSPPTTGHRLEHNGKYLEDANIDGCVAVGRKTDDAKLGKLPRTEAQEARWQMHQKVLSPAGQAIYALRKIIPSPVFGLIKRVMGFGRFSTHGLDKVCAEWSLVCACFNLRRLFWRRARAAAAA